MNILEKLLDMLKKPVVDAIINNYKEMTLAKVDEISNLAGANPQSFSDEIFNLAKIVNENVVIPIAVIIITFVAIQEIIGMVIDRNSMHDFDTFMFFKWFVKTYISIYLVANSFNFIMAIFSIGQNLVGGVSTTFGTSTDVSSVLAELESTLESKNTVDLLLTMVSSYFMSISNGLINLIAWVISVGRLMEIYFVISVSSLPFATLTSGRYSNTGDNYIKTVISLGIQGMFMVLAVAFYSTYVNSISGELFAGIGQSNYAGFKLLGAGVLLVFTLLKTKSIANSVVGAS